MKIMETHTSITSVDESSKAGMRQLFMGANSVHSLRKLIIFKGEKDQEAGRVHEAPGVSAAVF